MLGVLWIEPEELHFFMNTCRSDPALCRSASRARNSRAKRRCEETASKRGLGTFVIQHVQAFVRILSEIRGRIERVMLGKGVDCT